MDTSQQICPGRWKTLRKGKRLAHNLVRASPCGKRNSLGNIRGETAQPKAISGPHLLPWTHHPPKLRETSSLAVLASFPPTNRRERQGNAPLVHSNRMGLCSARLRSHTSGARAGWLFTSAVPPLSRLLICSEREVGAGSGQP